MLVGAVSKSALLPFHFWLPAAMAAPTPVSAYLHAAAMVKAGVYLVALLAPAFAGVPGWRILLLTVGLFTMLLGGWRALRQFDIKLLLAYGTVSQLGFLTVVLSLGTQAAALAGLAMLIAHALFKAALFMVVGIVDHQAGTRDLRKLSGVGRSAPVLAVAALLAGGSMAGLPLLAGFVAKESVYAALIGVARHGEGTGIGGWAVGRAGRGRGRLGAHCGLHGPVPVGGPRHQARCGAIRAGADPGRIPGRAGSAGRSVRDRGLPGRTGDHAALAVRRPVPWSPARTVWPCGTARISRCCSPWSPWRLGSCMFWQRRAFADIQYALSSGWSAERGYFGLVRWVDRAAVEVTGFTQRGSVTAYLSVILMVVVLLPGSALLAAGLGRVDLVGWDNVGQPVVATIVVVAAVLTTRARRRLKSVVLVGVTGYGTAMLFLLHGAPDLALTQVLVETVTLVVFVLVLRRLPEYFTDRPLTPRRFWRIALGVVVAAMVAGVMIATTGARTATPVSADFPREAVAFGGGRNIVNVTLVDIRAWDTLGEISVLVAAATGVASLVFLSARGADGPPGLRPPVPGRTATCRAS